MDTILAMIGICLTIIIGFWGIQYSKKTRTKCELIYLQNDCISLFRGYKEYLNELVINYKGVRISDNLIVMRGTFLNSGNVDLDKSRIFLPLGINLPSNYTWRDYKISNVSDGLNVSMVVEKQNLIFQWDLFKEGETFSFDSLVEYKNENLGPENINIENQLKNKLKVIGRIKDVKEINKISFNFTDGFGLASKVSFLIAFITLAVFGIMMLLAEFLPVNLTDSTSNNKTEFSFISGSKDISCNMEIVGDTVIIYDINNLSILRKYTKPEFAQAIGKELIVRSEKPKLISTELTGLSVFVMMLTISAIFYLREQKTRRIYNLLKNNIPPHKLSDYL